MATKKKRPRPVEDVEAEETTANWGSHVKGIIAIMITALVVVIVTMLFAKSLFVSTASAEKQTGKLTTPPNYTTVTTTTTEQVTTTKKKKTTTTAAEEEDPYKSELSNADATEMTVKGSVFLRSQPTSSSQSLATLPVGATVKAYAIINGNWLYIDYNGQKGYAFADFFNGTKPTATSVPA